MARERIGAQAACGQLSGWKAADGRDAITKTFKFADFNTAFGFMARVALKAPRRSITIRSGSSVYNRVDVLLATHDADGVTGLDVELADFMDEVARTMGAQQ